MIETLTIIAQFYAMYSVVLIALYGLWYWLDRDDG